jgi:hypothetical protein
MPRKAELIAHIPCTFYFNDPVRSTMKPLLIAAMTLAYQWSELIGSNGFLTEPQLYQALGQISAHGFPIEDVIRDLVVLNQLDDVGTGYQLPLLRVHRERLAHAAADRDRYHKQKGKNSKNAEPGVNIPLNTMGARAKTGSVPPNASHRHAAPEPVSEVRQSAPDPVPTAETSGREQERGSRTRPLHSDASFHRSEKSSLTETTSEVRGSGSGFNFSDREEQKQSPAQASEAEAPDVTKRWDEAAADPTYGLDPEDFECVTELIDRFRSPISVLPPDKRGQLCPRRSYAPPAELLSRWVLVMPMDQIIKDLDRYREKGVCDVIAVREHDSRFESFMHGTMTYKHQQMEVRLKSQREVRAALKRAKAHRERARQSEAAQASYVPPPRPVDTKPKGPTPEQLRKQAEAEQWAKVEAARAACRLKREQEAKETVNAA